MGSAPGFKNGASQAQIGRYMHTSRCSNAPGCHLDCDVVRQPQVRRASQGGPEGGEGGVPKLQFCKKTTCSSYVEPWLVAIGGWRLAVGGGWWQLVAVGARGGCSNRPYADSFPLPCHFQGWGGGGGAGSGGGLRGLARGGGGLRTPTYMARNCFTLRCRCRGKKYCNRGGEGAW